MPAARPAPLTHRRLVVDGRAVEVRGTFDRGRPAVVLVHGIGVSGEYFLPLAAALAADRDVYALDLPGYGTAPGPRRPLSVPELARVLAGTVRALELRAPVLVGHSMGCQVVVDAVAGDPGLCAGWVLLGPTVDASARGPLRQAWRLLRDTLREPPATNRVILRNYLRMGPVRYLRTVRTMLADRIEADLPRCAAPGLVVRGARDPIAPRRWAEQLARLAPRAGCLEIPAAAHAVQHTRPQELAAACAPFLDALAGRTVPPGS
ncbi:alpha/beta hydrolase [Kocuria sp. LUK]|uniref:alpha/beta fold hydrolase n=1 Tax=Kocuria TaxID=57493 RepID=UPI001E2E6936|nr:MULTISPECIES: alpha/beta hydrolase [Kocuria]MCD1145620.1 alpha/beta hydrolase [Kocuria sp. LUK]MCJ8505013.1 alpha/beta hydrolase [Kocuria flava]